MESEPTGHYTGEFLREHQRTVFDETVEFLKDVENTSGYIELPTGTGKTVLFVELSKHVLESSLLEDNSLPNKILVVVPRVNLLHQTSGERYENKGFSHFAEDISVSLFYGKEKETDGDVVIATYQSLPKMFEAKEWLQNEERLNQMGSSHLPSEPEEFRERLKQGRLAESIDNYGLVIFDEAHHLFGEKKRELFNQLSEDVKKLGLTATPETTHDSLDTVFAERIHDMSLEEAIDLELLSPVKLYAVSSASRIDNLELNSQGDYSEESLHGLIEDDKRNKIILETATEFVESGLQGVVSCVRGQEILHARDVAELLSRVKINEPDGTTRFMSAAWVGGIRKESENEQILHDFEKGFYDVLTYVDTLGEGWDSSKAKFLINARPTASERVAKQRLGRVLRRQDQLAASYVVDIVDEIADKPQVLAYDLLPSSRYQQGEVVQSPQSQDEQLAHTFSIDVEDVPALAMSYTQYRQLIQEMEANEQTSKDKPDQKFIAESKMYYGDKALKKELGINNRLKGWILDHFGESVDTTTYVSGHKINTAISSEWLLDELSSSERIAHTADGAYKDEAGTVWMSKEKLQKVLEKLGMPVGDELLEKALGSDHNLVLPAYTKDFRSSDSRTRKYQKNIPVFEELVSSKQVIHIITSTLRQS